MLLCDTQTTQRHQSSRYVHALIPAMLPAGLVGPSNKFQYLCMLHVHVSIIVHDNHKSSRHGNTGIELQGLQALPLQALRPVLQQHAM